MIKIRYVSQEIIDDAMATYEGDVIDITNMEDSENGYKSYLLSPKGEILKVSHKENYSLNY